MHSIATHTRNDYVSLNPWWIRYLVVLVQALLGHERFLRDAMDLRVVRAQIDSLCHRETSSQPNVFGYWIPAPYFSIVQAEQNECSMTRSK